MRTEFTLNDKLLTEPSSKDEETLSKIELEFEIQSKIVSASLKLLNEVHNKKNIRKQRKANYDQAVLKLNALEQKLIPMRKLLEENRRSKIKKKQQIIKQLNKDSDINQLNFRPPNEDFDHKRIKKNRIKLPPPHQHQISLDDESSLQDFKHQHPNTVFKAPNSISQKVAFVPISPLSRRPPLRANLALQRPNSTTFDNYSSTQNSANDEEIIQSFKSVHFSASQSDADSVSLNSDGMNSVIIHATPPAPRKGILTNSQSALNSRDRPRYRPATAVGLPISNHHFVDEEPLDIRRSNTFIGGVRDSDSPVDSLSELSGGVLTRTNSLENTRRKSYISAIAYPPSVTSTSNFHHQHYQNHHPSRFSRQKNNLPKNPPPPVPVSINMAQRPLPPPPCSQSMSVPDVKARVDQEESEIDDGAFHLRDSNPVHLNKALGDFRITSRDTNEFDISTKAVRSTVVRTPIGITISTTSSSEAQPCANNNNASSSGGSPLPPPPPPVTPGRMLPPPPPSPLATIPPISLDQQMDNLASEIHLSSSYRTNCYDNSRSETPCSSRPPSVASSVRSFNAISSSASSYKPPLALIRKQPENSVVPIQIEKVSTGLKKNTPSLHHHQHTASLTSFDEVDARMARATSPAESIASSRVLGGRNLESPRPVSIPLSPTTVVTAGAQVDVVSVGQFTPYWEETKPYELSDFYKYSAKHRSKQAELVAKNSQTTASEHPTGEPSSQEHIQKHNNLPPPPPPSNANLMEESFITNSAVATDFHDEMYGWYEENLKKPTVV